MCYLCLQQDELEQSTPFLAGLGFTNVEQSEYIDNNPFLAGMARSAGIVEEIQRFRMWDENTVSYKYNGSGIANDGTTTVDMSQDLIDALDLGLADISAVANLNFVEVSDDADMDVYAYTQANSGTLGYSYGVGSLGSYYNTNGFRDGPNPEDNGLNYGGFNYRTVIHELLHNVGIMHPHDRYAKFPGVTTSGSTGDFALNQNLYTVMSYNRTRQVDNNGEQTTGWGDNGYGFGVMGAFDIAMLQALYGANTSTATGNDVYLIPETNGEGTYYISIWDAGGTDELRYNGVDDVTIQLRAATLDIADGMKAGGLASSADGIHGGFTIANGVVIENGTGGAGDDFIVGNNIGNILRGNAGFDILRGLKGSDSLFGGDQRDKLIGGGKADLLDGGRGNDVMKGGRGGDTIIAGNGADKIIGGKGGDEFQFDSSDGWNQIFDFQNNSDSIRILDGPAGFAGLGITYVDGDARITAGDTTIVLRNVADGILDASDFDFGFA